VFYTNYEGINVYAFPTYYGESDSSVNIADYMPQVMEQIKKMDETGCWFYDAMDIDGIVGYLLITDKPLTFGTIMEKVVWYLRDLEDPDFNPHTDEWDDETVGNNVMMIGKDGRPHDAYFKYWFTDEEEEEVELTDEEIQDQVHEMIKSVFSKEDR
jgi:hypothetical protein